jgi:RNA polymerase sigma-70 factor (ECF subfamily)
VDDGDWLTETFEQHRSRLRAVAYRMLGSVGEADDALQEAWLRVTAAGADDVENIGAWLTTVVARVCLNLLRARRNRREDPLDVHVPDPIVSPESGVDPEHEALLADSVGLALMVVLDLLAPAERLAFVLHDMFAVPYDEIAPMIDRTPAAARQLASRARRRVQGEAPAPDPDTDRQQEVVQAFFAATRDGDFEALVALLDPDVVFRSDGGARSRFTIRLSGARTVADQTLTSANSQLLPYLRPALVNGAAGVVVAVPARPLYVMGFTVVDGRIAAIDVLADPDRLADLDLSAINR